MGVEVLHASCKAKTLNTEVIVIKEGDDDSIAHWDSFGHKMSELSAHYSMARWKRNVAPNGPEKDLWGALLPYASTDYASFRAKASQIRQQAQLCARQEYVSDGEFAALSRIIMLCSETMGLYKRQTKAQDADLRAMRCICPNCAT